MKLALKIFSIFLLLCGLTGMTGSVTWILRRGNNNRVTRLFIICQLAIVLWLISQLLILFSVNSEQLWISYLIGNIGISIFSPFWLMFSAEFAGLNGKASQIMKFMPLVSVSAVLLVISNPLHGFYYSSFGKGLIEYGRAFYVYQVIYYLCILAGITMMCIKSTKEHDRTTKQTSLLTISAAVPMAINTLTVTKVINVGIELTPLFFAFSSIMILLAIGKYGLLNINSIAINDTITNISSGVIVFDINDVLSYRNKYASELIDSARGDFTFEQFIKAVEKKSGTSIERNFRSVELEYSGEYYNLRQSFCDDRSGRKIARIILINNVTEYYELARTEKQLSIEQERNRIAQEIHDSAGHTFTMISSLSRILQLKCEGDDETEKYLREIDGLSRSGVTQLRCSINNLRDDSFMTSVTRAVKTITEAVRNVNIDLCIQGTEDSRWNFCIRQVYDNCRETITNAMRYSDADRIDIIIKFSDDMLRIYIFDNGRGCGEIKENNGLRGIRKRTEEIGGKVTFSSIEGEGFSTKFEIPVKK